MPSTYEANIEGAIEILVDIMLAESVTMAREPYAPNFRGLVDALKKVFLQGLQVV